MSDLKYLLTIMACITLVHAAGKRVMVSRTVYPGILQIDHPAEQGFSGSVKLPVMKNESNIQPCDHAVVRTFCGIFSDIDHLPQEIYTDRKDLTLPAINVIETAGTYLFEMALPGYQAANLRLEREDDVLTVHAVTHPLHSKEVMKYYKQEFMATSFTRSFLLPEDAGSVTAGFTNGVLSIRLSKQLPALAANLQQRQVIPIQ